MPFPPTYERKPRSKPSHSDRHRERTGTGKVCGDCHQFLPFDRFGWSKDNHNKGRFYRRSICIECNRARCRNYQSKNKASVFDNVLRKRYGITLAEYQAMHDTQGGVCAICKRPERSIDPRTKSPRRLAVDHCHDTGQVRGLLCCPCNQAIGQLQNDPAVLLAAIAYLERYV